MLPIIFSTSIRIIYEILTDFPNIVLIYIWQDAFQPNNLGNEGESETSVSVEPELHWYVESVSGENISGS